MPESWGAAALGSKAADMAAEDKGPRGQCNGSVGATPARPRGDQASGTLAPGPEARHEMEG